MLRMNKMNMLRPDTLMSPDAPATVPQRARGAVDVAVHLRDGGTHLTRLRQSGCMKCILPQVFRSDAEAVLINTSGGVTGGDAIEVAVNAGAGTQLSITTQAAERIYRTHDGTTGRVANRATVGVGARLNWLPQETILFDRARLERSLEIDIAADAQLLLCETLVFGRAAMGEQVQDLYLKDCITVTRENAPLYRDGIRLIGNARNMMARAAIGGGFGVVATLVYVAPDAAAKYAPVCALLPTSAGVSLRNNGVLVLRALAEDSLSLRRFMIPVLELLSGQSLPGVWRL